MKMHTLLLLFVCALGALAADPSMPERRTTVSISGGAFQINGEPTYKGRVWNGRKIEGLLLNSRMVQGIFDDRNPETAKLWAYSDTGKWDAERNTREFIAAMPEWRRNGLLAFTINLQGGSPQGYSQSQPWHNSAFDADGSLRADYLARLEKILDRADELGMAVILGYFYFGQDQRLSDEAAVVRATDAATKWLLDHRWRHVLVEINNECNVNYDHAILQPARVHELIERVKSANRDGRCLLAGTSYGGGAIPKENVVHASDFILLHGNGVSEPKRIGEMVHQTRAVSGYNGQPIIFNEDDHFDFEKTENNFTAAIGEYASWGCFDYRMKGEGFDEGYQSVPVNWGVSSARKRGFFKLLAEITGSRSSAAFQPGEIWLDTDGKPIQAHSAGILIRGDTYYWHGEDRTPRRRGGVSCYASTNLYDWKDEGVVFSPESLSPELRTNTFIERPKVVYNAKTRKYVLWMHLEQRGYHFASAGVAIGDSPKGPFAFTQHLRPIPDDIGYKSDDIDRQKELGGTYRDMNLFVDDDGAGYAFYASEGNATMYVVRLNAEFTGPETPTVAGKTWARILIGQSREAPAPFKYKGRYYLITSGCTGWNPNAADYAVADNILGPWESKGNPCMGPDSAKTFGAQSTFVVPVAGKPGCFIFMADRWKPKQLSDSRYVWLPLILKQDGGFTLEWRDRWDLSVFDKY
jgi:hypothetical protein